MLSDTVENIVRSRLNFSQSSNSWNRIFCEVCGDGGRTKGPRGGWLFQGDMAFFHCFNCGIDASFDPNREIPHSKEMYKIFRAFDISKEDIDKILFSKKINKTSNKSEKPQRQKVDIKELAIPDHFYKLSDADSGNVIATKAKDYLMNERLIDPDSYPFYLSTGIAGDSVKDQANAKILINRLIIPSFRNNKMVYFIARALDDTMKTRYINPPVPKGNIIYGFDRLYNNAKGPLFVTEGFFDAHHLKGVAVLENHMTKEQIDILNSSSRNKVVVPDKNKKNDSQKLAEQAIGLGWGVSLPVIGSCKDITEAIKKYGKLYVIDSAMKNIFYGAAAELGLKNYYSLR